MGKKILCVILTLMMMALVACGGKEEKALTNKAEFENSTLELLDATIADTDDGRTVVKIIANYTNETSEGGYAYSYFKVKAFQNDMEIADVSDINGEEAALIQSVKDGASLQVHYVFELTDNGEVDVKVYTPTADEVLIAEKLYTFGAESE